MPDNEGSAPTFASHRRIILPKAGIIITLKIPNSSNTNRQSRAPALHHLMIWYKTTNSITAHRGATQALAALLHNHNTTGNITSENNGSTMTDTFFLSIAEGASASVMAACGHYTRSDRGQ